MTYLGALAVAQKCEVRASDPLATNDEDAVDLVDDTSRAPVALLSLVVVDVPSVAAVGLGHFPAPHPVREGCEVRLVEAIDHESIVGAS